MPKGIWKKIGLEAIKSRRGPKTKARVVSDEELDKVRAKGYIPKPSEEEVNLIVESLFDNSIWERAPGIYANALELYGKKTGPVQTSEA